MENVRKIVDNLINDKVTINQKSLLKLINLLKEYYKIDSVLKKVEFTKEHETVSYVIPDCVIVINENSQRNFIDGLYEITCESYQKVDYERFYLFMQLVMIFHEIEHARQYLILKTKSEKDVLINERIILECMKYLQNSKIYEDYKQDSSIFPIEKDANLFGYYQSFNIFLKNNLINKNLYYTLAQLYYINLMIGYSIDFKDNNLEDFYSKTLQNRGGYDELLNSLSNLSLYEKLSVNLPLNNEEIKICREIESIIYSGYFYLNSKCYKKGLEKHLIKNLKNK